MRWLWIVLALSGSAFGACSSTAFGSFTCVQQTSVIVGSGTSATLTTGSNITTGHILLLIGNIGGGTLSFDSTSCTGISSVTTLDSFLTGVHGFTGSAVVNSSTGCTILVKGSSSGTILAFLFEIAGSSNTIDQHTAVYQGTTNQCPNISTGVDGDLILCLFDDISAGAGTFTAGTCGATCTIMAQNAGTGMGGEAGVQTSHGSITPTWTYTQPTSFMFTGTIALEPPASASTATPLWFGR